MTDNERQEIKMIADFMGIRIREWLTCFWTCDEETLGIDPDSGDEVYSPARNWQHLMPVVEKISQMNNQSVSMGSGQRYIRGLGVYDTYCRFENWKGELISESAEQKTLIDAAYKAVVEFIKWYNQQPK